ALVVHLPQRLSLHSAKMLRELSRSIPTTVIVGMTGIVAADDEVRTSLRRLGIDGDEAAGIRVPFPVDLERTTILTASDGDEEVRAAVRAVVDAVRAGTRLDRIAVLHASPEPYARLAHEQLHAAGIVTNGAAVVPLAARMAGRTLLELLGLPDGGYRRQDVFAWLSSAPVLHDGRWAPTTAWERLSRQAAVVAGRDDWDGHLAQLADQQDRRAEQADADDDEPDSVADQARTLAGRARDLRRFVLRVIDDLSVVGAAPLPWSEHARWAQGWLEQLLGVAARRDSWPLDERKAAERVEVALDRLGALDAVEGPVPLEVFARTLTLELESDLGRVGRFGDGVLVGSVEMGTGLDLDLVVVLGLAEGSFPSTVRDDSLLPDHERHRTGGELGLRADRVERQHRHLLGALAGARRQLLCVPRGDLRRSVERVPSRWVLDLASSLAGRRWWPADLHAAVEPWVTHVASFDAGLRTMAVPATGQEHRLRSLLATGGSLADTDDAATLAGHAVLTARRSGDFTRFDGNLVGLGVPSPVDGITSPTRLERWASCPHAHLVQDLLKAPPVENPEDNLMITALQKGRLIHQILEDFVGEVLARPEAERPSAGDSWTAADRARLQDIGAQRCNEVAAQGLTGRPIFWKRDRRRILADLHRFLDDDQRHRAATGTVPVAVELGFGFGVDGELPAVEVALPDGRVLRVRGRADRLDRAADGTLHVVDYKTGKADRYKNLSESDPIAGGTRLQLPLYGLAARLADSRPGAPVRAEYWFPTTRGKFARHGYDVTDEVLAETQATLGVIVGGVEAGVFPPHPDSNATFFYVACPVCDPDGLGTVELRRHWERKRRDPALAAYAMLAEPLDDDENGPA
ncbi:MAG: PD-(D/E)XK nuclease family protein, partial [Acidimicrobiales bacterium]